MKPVIYSAISVVLFLGCEQPTGSFAFDEQEPAAPPKDVREFVRRTYFHGVPYDQASQYGRAAVPVLAAMLKDAKEAPYWSNVAITLCMIGDESAAKPVIEFIDEGAEAELSASDYAAKSNAVMALGYLVNKCQSRDAFTYLKASLRPGIGAERKIKWLGPAQTSAAARDQALSKKAILGLALCGTPEAAEFLRSLRQPGDSPESIKLRRAVSDLVDVALKEHEKVSKQGLSEYYKKPKRGG